MTSKRATSPGPAAYLLPSTVGYKGHDTTRWKYPAYKMGLVLRKSKDLSNIPGPKYLTRDMTRFGKVHPENFVFNSRRSMKKGFQAPGPGAYSPEKFDHKIRKEIPPKYSMGLALRSEKGTTGPGPAGYNLRPKFPPGPAYSLGLKLPKKSTTGSPGPAAYDVANGFNKIKPRPPTVKLSGRPTAGIKSFGPGPIHKYDIVLGRRAPGFSFGVKHGENVSTLSSPEDNACVLEPDPC